MAAIGKLTASFRGFFSSATGRRKAATMVFALLLGVVLMDPRFLQDQETAATLNGNAAAVVDSDEFSALLRTFEPTADTERTSLSDRDEDSRDEAESPEESDLASIPGNSSLIIPQVLGEPRSTVAQEVSFTESGFAVRNPASTTAVSQTTGQTNAVTGSATSGSTEPTEAAAKPSSSDTGRAPSGNSASIRLTGNIYPIH